jgi:capsid protein
MPPEPMTFTAESTVGLPAMRMPTKRTKVPFSIRMIDKVGGFVSGALSIVAPERAFHMERSRQAFLSVRGYDAFNKSRLTQHRVMTNRDADSEMNGKLSRIRSFAREEVRNNGFARNMVRARRHNVVGDSDTGQGITIDPAVTGADGKPNVEANKKLKALWKLYKDRIELTGRWGEQDLYSLAESELFVGGEVLAVFHDKPAQGSDLPFSVEMIEPDRLPTSMETLGGGTGVIDMNLVNQDINTSDPSALQFAGQQFGSPTIPWGEVLVVGKDGKPEVHTIKHGIEYGTDHQIVAYHILKDHPGNQYALQNHFATVRVPASHVIHYFEPDRAEQTRGVSGLTAALPLLADLRDLITWELIAVKMAACFGVHVEGGSMNPLLNQANTTQGGPLTDAYGNPVTQLQPGLLTMGQGKITQLQGARPGGTFLPFFQSLLRFACAGADMGFSTTAKDYTGGSFSSLRQEALEDRRGYRAIQGLHVRHLCIPIWKRFVRACALKGLINAEAYFADPERWSQCYVNTPGWDYVNPLQEATAEAVMVTNGFKTLDEVTNNSNMEPGERLQSLAAYKAAAELMGLTMPWAYGVAKPGTDGGKVPKAEKAKQEQMSADADKDGGPSSEQLAEVGVQSNDDFGGADEDA